MQMQKKEVMKQVGVVAEQPVRMYIAVAVSREAAAADKPEPALGPFPFDVQSEEHLKLLGERCLSSVEEVPAAAAAAAEDSKLRGKSDHLLPCQCAHRLMQAVRRLLCILTLEQMRVHDDSQQMQHRLLPLPADYFSADQMFEKMQLYPPHHLVVETKVKEVSTKEVNVIATVGGVHPYFVSMIRL